MYVSVCLCVCVCVCMHTCVCINTYISKRIFRTRRRGNCFNLREEKVRLDKGKNFCSGGGKLQAQIAQRGCKCPIPGHIQGWAGWGL